MAATLNQDWKQDRIGSANRGENPSVLLRMKGGYAVIGDNQFLPGYSLLLCDVPGINHLSDLELNDRIQFLKDMSLLGEAIELAWKEIQTRNDLPPALANLTFRRMNYDILGNKDAYLHAHVWPRFEEEDPELKVLPVWVYPRNNWTNSRTEYSDQVYGLIKERIVHHLKLLVQKADE
ncbi:hypothetical protein HDU79_009321 [Rhizoclosmatium sp. JEL0117]|nr:hypothetical protein HDU79_009321 [Rhizoclosmatium sp. JEL0117]